MNPRAGLVVPVGTVGPECLVIPDGTVFPDGIVSPYGTVIPPGVVVPAPTGQGIGFWVSGVEGTTGVVILRGGQQLVRLGRRNSEHDRQIVRPDAVPVNQVYDLAGMRRGV